MAATPIGTVEFRVNSASEVSSPSTSIGTPNAHCVQPVLPRPRGPEDRDDHQIGARREGRAARS